MAQTSGIFAALSDQVAKVIVDFTKQGLVENDPIHPKLFSDKSTTKKFERFQSIAPFGTAPRKGEGEEYSFDQIQAGYTKDITPLEYGFGFLWTETAQEDDDFEVLGQYSKWLGFSVRIMQETQAAAVLNDGLAGTVLTADGLALFSTAHLLKRGGTAKNKLSTAMDLSVTALAQMRADMRMNTKLESGQLVRPQSEFYLVHHPDNEALAIRICNSEKMPLEANNDINPTQKIMKVTPLCWEYISDSDATFLVAKKSSSHGLKMLSRVKPRLNPVRVDPKTGNNIVSIRVRQVWDAFDWRNIAATEGA
ncbi:MAG: hypothetical protein ABL982_00030 [Vicinamibacterales bacterium]